MGSSEPFPLAEFKPRREGENRQKRHLNGSYGAIPELSMRLFEQAVISKGGYECRLNPGGQAAEVTRCEGSAGGFTVRFPLTPANGVDRSLPSVRKLCPNGEGTPYAGQGSRRPLVLTRSRRLRRRATAAREHKAKP